VNISQMTNIVIIKGDICFFCVKRSVKKRSHKSFAIKSDFFYKIPWSCGPKREKKITKTTI
jgi:hypothetical protein